MSDTPAPGSEESPTSSPVPQQPVPSRPPSAGDGMDVRSGLPLASFGKRAGAYLIDVAIIVVAFIAVGIVTAVAGAINDGLGLFVGAIGWIVVAIGSAALLIVSDGGRLGQTPGKFLTGIKVVGATPGPLGYGRGALRYVGRILDTIVCGLPIGLVWPLFDAQNRTWHDLIADTRVVIAPQQDTSLSYWLANVRV